MEAVILAGGLGTRLRSVISDVPKCMASVVGKPFLWYLLDSLKPIGLSSVVLSVGYLHEIIEEWVFQHRYEFPFEIKYALEEEPLGTGGGIRHALSKTVDSDVMVLNGDTFFQVDYSQLYVQHRKMCYPITLALKQMRKFERYGNVKVDAEGNIIAFDEKQYCEEGFINGGVYIINKNARIFENLPLKFSFETEVLQPLCTQRKLYGVVQNGYFIDIGIPEDYEKALSYFQNYK